MTTTKKTTGFSIFVSTLDAYNEGLLDGDWVDLPQNDLQQALSATGLNMNGETFISDYEVPENCTVTVGLYSNYYRLNKKIAMYENELIQLADISNELYQYGKIDHAIERLFEVFDRDLGEGFNAIYELLDGHFYRSDLLDDYCYGLAWENIVVALRDVKNVRAQFVKYDEIHETFSDLTVDDVKDAISEIYDELLS